LDNLKLSIQIKEKRKEILHYQGSQTIAILVNSFHLSLEDRIVSLEDGIFVGKLLGDIWLASEN